MEESSSEEDQGLKCLNQLINLMLESVNISKLPSSSKFIKNYMRSYQIIVEAATADFAEDHAPLFQELFYNNREKFMNVHNNDTFLVTDSLQVWYGKNTPMVKKKNMRLPITVCMKLAKELREDKSRHLNDDPDHDSEVMNATEYILYGEIKYFLLRTIQYSLPDGSVDKSKLEEVLTELRLDTTLSEDEDDNQGVQGMFKMMTDLVDIGDNKVDKKEMGNMSKKITEVMGDKEVSGTIKDSVRSLPKYQKGANFGDMLKQTFERVGPTVENVLHRKSIIPPGTISMPEGVPKESTPEDVEDTLDKMMNTLQTSVDKVATGLSK